MMSAHERPAMKTVSPEEKHQIFRSHPRRKILFVSNTREFGGAEKDLIELIQRLCGPGLQVSILCLGTDFFSERLGSNLGVDITTCSRVPDSMWDWLRVLRVSQPDVVVFVYGWSGSFRWTASIGARLAGIRRRFSIQQLVSPERNTNRHPIRRMLRWLVGSLHLKVSASLFHTTICVSDAMRDSLIKDFGFPAKKMKTIHNGVSVSQFVPSESNGLAIRAKLGIDREEFLLVCAARLSDQKGIEILLQAMAQVIREGVRCKCVIVGDGPLRDQLLKQARGLSLCDHVFFEGFREDVRPYLQASSAFILTSHWEGLPLSILEAMACGLPSIVTDVGGNAEAITHQINGLVAPAGSVGAVADAISYLATHPHERAQMSKMARARACEAFDIEKRMAEIKRVILN